MASSSFDSSDTSSTQQLKITRDFKILKVLGEGSFGSVIKCKNRYTGEIVAVKVPKTFNNLYYESFMMKFLMSHDLDKSNIIKYHGELQSGSRLSLMFEMLDISLYDHMVHLEAPMCLKDIRTIIEQMATAFDALAKVGVIHTDVKLDNIMIVDREQPLKVKLIDFGLAIFRSQAKQGSIYQPTTYRAPEILLGLPFSEAIDIWSLGCVMATLMFGCTLFSAVFAYDALRLITDLIGPPPQYLIERAMRSSQFFNKTDQWVLKTPKEYWGERNYSVEDRFYTFHSLDETKTMLLEEDNPRELDERREAVELLKAMLCWDGEKRITPAGILKHPFITKSYLTSSSQLSSCVEPAPGCSGQTRQKASNAGRVDDSTCKALPPGVIMVRPAPPRNRIHLEETSDVTSGVDSDMSCYATASSSSSEYISLTDPDSSHPSNDFKDQKDRKDNMDHRDHMDRRDHMDQGKQKKSRVRRFFSWVRKTFVSCTA